MDWRIKEITYTNFKFFKDPFSLKLNGRNLLLYGENGSGKSSISMGLYTLLESRKKTLPEVQKYFQDTPGNDEHLRNRYSSPTDHSSITITYTKTVDNSTEKRTIGDEIVETQNNADLFCQQSLTASDVISYRTLTDLLYRKNSNSVDLLDIFTVDFFLFIDLDEPYTDLQGNKPTPSDLSISSWLKFLNCENVNSVNINQFNILLEKFETKVNNELGIIEGIANNILRDELEHPEIEISLDFEVTEISEDGLMLKRPKLLLKAKETNTRVAGWTASVHHLATHFNEARLTCIAIALRMAIAEQRHLNTPNINAFLCIDDLLISLDMGNRIPVIKMILSREDKWQLLILTHDRTLFEEFLRQIPDIDKNTKWSLRELYVKHPKLSEHEYPEPFLKEQKSYRASAEYYFIHSDYATCANHLRKFAEEQLKIFLPKNLQLQEDNEVYKTKELNALIGTMSKYAKQLGINEMLLPSIDFYRQRLLNPLSHNDISTPAYRNELEACFKELDKFPALIDSTYVLVTSGETENKKWQIEVSNGGTSDKLTFKALEPWVYIELGGDRYYQDIEIEVCHNDSDYFHDHAKGTLSAIFTSICKGVGYTDSAAMPVMADSIALLPAGTTLSTYVGGDFRKSVNNGKMN